MTSLIKVLLVERGLCELVVGVETDPVTWDTKDIEIKLTTSPGKSFAEESKNLIKDVSTKVEKIMFFFDYFILFTMINRDFCKISFIFKTCN